MSLQNNRCLAKTADILAFLQPILIILIYLSIVLGSPPAALTWSLFIVSTVPACITHGAFHQRTPFDIPILIFIVGLSISLSFSPYREISLETFQTYMLCIMAYYIIVFNGLRSVWYWRFLVAILVVLSFSTLVTATFAQQSPGARVLPYNEWLYHAASKLPFAHSYHLTVNALGSVFGVIAPGLVGYAILSSDRRDKAMMWVFGVLAAVLVVLASSSSGLISMLAGFAFILWLWRRWALGILIPSGLIWLWLAISNHLYLPGWATWLAPHNTLVERVDIWRGSAQLIFNHPFTGLGPGAWFLRSNLYVDGWPVMNPHNDVLTLMSDAGVLAGVAFIAVVVIVGIILRRMVRSPAGNPWRTLGLALGASMVAFAANGIWETNVTGTLLPIPVGDMVYRYKCLATPTLWVLLALFVIAWIRFLDTKGE